jgi:hypothetical protein
MKFIPIAFVILCSALHAGAQNSDTTKPATPVFHQHKHPDFTLGPNNGQPLCIVDGAVMRSVVVLSQFNPNDIEKIEVLKDKSAEIFGELGMNGVIIITMKNLVKSKTTGFTQAVEQFIGRAITENELLALDGRLVKKGSIVVGENFVRKVEIIKLDGKTYLNAISFNATATVAPKAEQAPSTPAKPGTIMIRGTASAAIAAPQQY